MATLEFRTYIGGVSSISLGGIWLNISIGGRTYYYQSLTSASEFSTVAACVTTAPIQIPDHNILHNFAGQDVQFNVGGGVLGRPPLPSRLMRLLPAANIPAMVVYPLDTNITQRTEIEFKIYYTSGRTNDPVYSTRIGATVTGIVLTPLKTYSRFRQIPLDGVR